MIVFFLEQVTCGLYYVIRELVVSFPYINLTVVVRRMCQGVFGFLVVMCGGLSIHLT